MRTGSQCPDEVIKMSVLSRVRRLFFLNVYAYLLTLCTLTSGVAAYVCFSKLHWHVTGIILGIVAFILLTQTFRNYVNWPHRKRIFKTLCKRNREVFHFQSFEEYVDAPCHRMVIRLVLIELNQKDKYREIMRRYYLPPWKRYNRKSEMIFFNDQKEAQEWLKNHQRS